MTTFDQRKEAFENKFAHDEEMRFRAHARRNRLLGVWAAGKLGMTGPSIDAYVQKIIEVSLKDSDEGVFQKVRTDFDTAGVEQSDHQIRRQMEEFLVQAMAEVEAA